MTGGRLRWGAYRDSGADDWLVRSQYGVSNEIEPRCGASVFNVHVAHTVAS